MPQKWRASAFPQAYWQSGCSERALCRVLRASPAAGYVSESVRRRSMEYFPKPQVSASGAPASASVMRCWPSRWAAKARWLSP